MQKTTVRNKDDIKPVWYIVDASDQVLGRLATRIANQLKGKGKPDFSPHTAMGDFVIVINAEKIKLTGDKWDKKLYRTHSGYMGHLKEWTVSEQRDKDATQIIRWAVTGMLHRNRLRNTILGRLKVYTGSEHPHIAQQAKELPA